MSEKVTVTVERITPELAKEWLSRSENFRRLDQNRVAKIARDIRIGAYELNGESIKFNRDGKLTDGQHRLAAIVLAGLAITSIVVRGLDSDELVDRGRPRTLAQILQHRGEKNANDLSAALRIASAYLCGTIKSYSSTGSRTDAELLGFLSANSNIRESVALAASLRQSIGLLPRSWMAAFHFLFSKVNREAANDFFLRLSDGSELQKNDPVYLLRDRFIKDKDAKARLLAVEKMALLIKAWNYYAAQRPLSTLRWVAVGRGAEEFPMIDGILVENKK